MNPITPRQTDILEIARREGRVDVETLAARFGVTHQTIRKDLNDLCNLGKLRRVHGGAMFPSSTVNLALQSRRAIAAEGKARIAREIARIVPDGASVILNIGTTTEAVAEALRRHENLMVITNNLNVAMLLYDAPGIELVISGGMVRKSDGGVVGAAAIDLIRQFRVDFAIVGASAIDEEGAVLDFDYREVRVAQAILGQARQKVLVADSTKFERRAPVQIGHITDMDMFVTDRPPPAEILALCRDNGVRVVVAEGPDET
jgi:DeoR family glycerol-3-phosphate regulon repressor